MKKFLWILIILIIIIFIGLFFLKTSFTISQVIDWVDPNQTIFLNDLPDLPEDDPNRIDILLLGMRGLEEEGDGKLLSDTMIIVSINQQTKQVALISLPRDLYVRIWCLLDKKKINFAYAHGGFDCAKKTVSAVTGVYIDYAIGVNFEALTEIVDTLGGVDVYLKEPFEEDFQWAKEGWEEDEHWFIKDFDGEERWVFYVPAGKNHLDGTTTLYYVRSRYSTDDFDRMRRQQQVLIALKQKALSLGVLVNPIKVYNLLDLLGKNVRTDIRLSYMDDLIDLATDLDTDNIITKVFDISPGGLLYHTFINEEYVLLPIGDDFEKIQEVCQNIFDL